MVGRAMGGWIKKTTKGIFKKSNFLMFLRAQLSSQLSSLIDYAVTIIFANVFGMFFGNATLLGNVSGGIANFFINYKWTFKVLQGAKIKHVVIKYTLVWLVNLFLNRQGTVLITDLVLKWLPQETTPDIIVNNVFLMPKIIVSLIVGFGWNYNMQRLFVYRNCNFRKYFTHKKKVAELTEKQESIE